MTPKAGTRSAWPHGRAHAGQGPARSGACRKPSRKFLATRRSVKPKTVPQDEHGGRSRRAERVSKLSPTRRFGHPLAEDPDNIRSSGSCERSADGPVSLGVPRRPVLPQPRGRALRYIVGSAWSTKCYMNMRPLYQPQLMQTEAVAPSRIQEHARHARASIEPHGRCSALASPARATHPATCHANAS